MSDHDHCDHDPIECTYDALVGEYREVVAARDTLARMLANMAECAHDADAAEPMCACPCHASGERDRLRTGYATATAAADAAAEAVGAMAEKLDATILESVRLREALALVYFHLGPPQPRLTDHTEVPALVEQAMAGRDRLRTVVDAIEFHWARITPLGDEGNHCAAIDQLIRSVDDLRMGDDVRDAVEYANSGIEPDGPGVVIVAYPDLKPGDVIVRADGPLGYEVQRPRSSASAGGEPPPRERGAAIAHLGPADAGQGGA